MGGDGHHTHTLRGAAANMTHFARPGFPTKNPKYLTINGNHYHVVDDIQPPTATKQEGRNVRWLRVL